MKPVYILGESIQGESYKSLIDYLLNKANIVSYEILKMSDSIYDDDDKKYYMMTTRNIMIAF